MNRATESDRGTCPSAAELAAFLSNELPPATMDEIGAHVSSCHHCDAAVRRMDGASGTLDSFPERHGDGAATPALVPTKRLAAGPSSSDPPPPVHLLGQYRIGERLGLGGMGAVYRAEHVRLKMSVAVKVLAPGQVRDPRAVARFQLEMEVVGRLDHPNIVRATDAGEADGIHFLVMELIDGVNLAHLLLRYGPLPVPTACELIRQAALGLQHAHEHGLVHRDIKPSNLMLTPSGQVKLLDLGLALLRTDRALGSDLTGAGEVMGTVEYMAPEQYTEMRSVDTRADVYSLGCTLYALLTGDPPFSGPERNEFPRMLWAHKHEAVRPVSELRADVPPALDAVLAHMLAKNPDDRPATPRAVTEALEPLAAGADLSGLSALGSAQNLPPKTQPLVSGGRSGQPAPPPSLGFGFAQAFLKRMLRGLSALLGFGIVRAFLKHILRGLSATPRPVPQEAPLPSPQTDQELAHELVEFGKRFELPKRGESTSDAQWFDEHWGTPTLTQYRGNFVAILNSAVVGHGANSLQLQLDMARKYNIHPQRLIIEYIPRPAL